MYGGGAELALCCDFRIGTPTTRLSVPAARLGVCYPVGGLGRYARRLGLGAASRILLSAEEMDGTELHRIGFLTHLVDAQDLDGVVDALVERLSGLAPLAVRSMKHILVRIADGSIDREEAVRRIEECEASEDLREGIRAARERRPPKFSGR